MSYDLRITISGLALYVPDGDAMHVLLPATEHHTHHAGSGGESEHPAGHDEPHAGHEHHHEGGGAAPASGGNGDEENDGEKDGKDKMEPHFTRIFYDVAHEDPNATQLSRTYRMMDFKGCALDLGGLPTAEPLTSQVPGEIPSMEGLAKRVPRALLQRGQDGAIDPKLAGLLMMKSGAISDCLLGARFELKGQQQRITVRSEWTVRGITTDEAVPAEGENGPRRPVLPAQPEAGLLKPLYPIGQTIRLYVFNALAEEFPPDGAGFNIGAPDEDGEHFLVYYDLARPVDEQKRPFPKLVGQHDVIVIGPGAVTHKGKPHGIQGLACVQAWAMAE